MTRRALLSSATLLVVLVALAPRQAAGDGKASKLEIVPLGEGLLFEKPTHVTTARDGTTRLFVCEQRGMLAVVDPGPPAKRADYLDLTAKTRTQNNEEGLLSVAFHPRFKENGYLYVAYSTGSRYYPSADAPNHKDAIRTRVSRFEAKPPGAATVDPATEKVVIEGLQPFGNHNGGQVAFGPDGKLYFGLGDGGAAGDPEGNGQKLERLLGKILRIDVDKGDPYSVPDDNPFVKVKDARPEIWCYGVRNPWRFSFDRETGALWSGDVGQNRVEIVQKIVKGSNNGWNLMEGNLPFNKRGGAPRDPLTPPVYTYPRADGASITGGFVYRGKKIPELVGTYVFGDYVSGHVFGLKEVAGGKPEVTRLIDGSNRAISSFGETDDGELLLVHHAAGRGEVFRLVAAKDAKWR